MPAFHLAEQTATLSRFDVVGMHSETSSRFVQHVALLDSDDCEVSCDDTVQVVHMGPPLETDELGADVAGRIPLTNDEINSINTWIEKVKDEYQKKNARRRQQYIIHPPWKDVRDENTGVRRYRRYSCAGFVLDAHLRVNVSLLMIDDEEALPEVTRQTLDAAYPNVLRNPDRPNRFGLQGNGPWRVVLAGYVLHALDRSSDEIRAEPYPAQGGDELF